MQKFSKILFPLIISILSLSSHFLFVRKYLFQNFCSDEGNNFLKPCPLQHFLRSTFQEYSAVWSSVIMYAGDMWPDGGDSKPYSFLTLSTSCQYLSPSPIKVNITINYETKSKKEIKEAPHNYLAQVKGVWQKLFELLKVINNKKDLRIS